jgi:hypothetical protein
MLAHQEEGVMRESRVRFIRQQGVTTPSVDDELYSALMLQPRVIGAIVALGIAVQGPLLFLALSAALLWSALVPTRNPFDAIYNHAVARPRKLPPLGAAPAPRRFAMGMAGMVALTIGIALLAGAAITAWVFEGLFAVAVMQVVLGDVCGAANLYHLVRRSLVARPSAALASKRRVIARMARRCSIQISRTP